VVCFAVFCVGLEIFSRYERYVTILKWGTLSLFAYVVTALAVDVPWRDVARAALVPQFSLRKDYVVAIVAVLGTTISPYLFFWQASEEAEDERTKAGAMPLTEAPEQAAVELHRIRLDTYVGMGFSNLISLFVIITTATTLHAHGVTDIQTSAQAAEAMRPIAGAFTYAVFAGGIIGTGLLAVPVLAGSAAYALGEAFGWTVGLARQPLDAKAFFGTIAISTLLGIAINFVPIDPIKALFWSAVLNGVVAVPLMIVMMLMTMRRQVMGPFTLPRPLWILGWLSTIAMALVVTIMFLT
jgi:Mn2+/Fe2+ NRAMP family transporter